MAESRGVGGDAHRARHRELASAAEREAVDGRDHGLTELFDGVEDLLAAARVLLALDRRLHGELVDVGAGDERLLARARQHDRAHARIGLEAGDGRRQLVMVWVFSAFRTFGRLKVTMATASSRSISRFSKVIP